MCPQAALWRDAALRQRCQSVLFVPLQAAFMGGSGQQHFGAPVLWRMDQTVHDALAADWEDLMGAIGAERGNALSAREGRHLQVRPKAAHSGVRRLGPSADGVAEGLPLGFYLRAHFVAAALAGRPLA